MTIDSGHVPTYRVLRGELGDQFGVLFPGRRLSRESGTTVLTGPVADQARLSGLIEKAQNLGLDLVCLVPVEPTPGSDTDAD